MWMGGWELSNYGQIYHQSNAKFWPDRAKFHPYILSYDHIWSIYAQIKQNYAYMKESMRLSSFLFLIFRRI